MALSSFDEGARSSIEYRHKEIGTRQDLLSQIFPMKVVREYTPFIVNLDRIYNAAKGGKTYRAFFTVESQTSTKQVFHIELSSQELGFLFADEAKINNRKQYSFIPKAIEIITNMIFAKINYHAKDENELTTLNGAYIPQDKSIRNKIKRREGLIEALQDGEQIVQVFLGDTTEATPIHYVCNVLKAVGDEIQTKYSFDITMSADELREKGFRYNDIAIAVRKTLGSKQIMSHLTKRENKQTKTSSIKSSNILNRKAEFERIKSILSD